MDIEDKKAKQKEYDAAYYNKNRDRLRKQDKDYYESHKEKSKLAFSKYYEEHKDKIKDNVKRTGVEVRCRQRIAVLRHYSNGTMACVQCGFSDIRALCLDHINGGGTDHRRKLRNGGNVWYWLARHGFPPGYQILCANCNTIKAREEDEYGSKGKIKSDWRSQLGVPLAPKTIDNDHRRWTPEQGG